MPKRILIVDDDQLNREIIRELLEEDYEIATATTGEEGLSRMKDFGPAIVDAFRERFEDFLEIRKRCGVAEENLVQV